jgi:tRNA(Ile)-lysidine synthase
VLDGVLGARRDATPLVRWGGGEIRRYRDRLYALAPAAEATSGNVAIADPAGASVELGSGLGRLRLVPGSGAGLRAPPAAAVSVRFRAGGESIRPHAARPRKRLKDLFQEAGVVPWMRGRLPLVYVGSRLAAVADLWVDAEFAAAAGEASLLPVWEQRPPLF